MAKLRQLSCRMGRAVMFGTEFTSHYSKFNRLEADTKKDFRRVPGKRSGMAAGPRFRKKKGV